MSGSDRERLARLVRYVARPATASERLELAGDGTVIYRPRRPFRDGTRTIRFESLSFLEKLAALAPPPRVHLVTYHGILAPDAGQASRSPPVPPRREDRPAAIAPAHPRRPGSMESTPAGSRGARITDPAVIRDVLLCLGLDPDLPSCAPPRDPDPAFDSSPNHPACDAGP